MKEQRLLSKKGKPIKLRRSLGLKLILYFIVFGLFLGGFVYIMSVLLDAGPIVRDIGVLITHKTPAGEAGKITDQHSIRKQNINLLLTDVQKKYSSLQSILVVKFYNLTSESNWQEVQISHDHDFTYMPVEKRLAQTLGLAFQEKLDLKNTNNLVLEKYIRVDGEKDPDFDMVHIRVDKNIFLQRIRADKELLFGYAFILILFSIILGYYFSKKITTPVNELIDSAQQISRGDYHYRNRIRCSDEIGYLGKVLNLMAEKVDSHIREIEYRSNTMEAMNRIDKTVLALLFDPHVVDIVAEIVASFLKTGMVVLAVPDLSSQSVKITSYQADKTMGLKIRTDPLLFSELNQDNDFRLQKFTEIQKRDNSPLPLWASTLITLEYGTIIHAPLTSADQYQGSCFVIDDKKRGFSEGEREAIRMLADQVGVALQNARIYREKEDLLLELLFALTKAIDAKSKWTAGHSERVALFAMETGRELHFPDQDIETLKMIAMLHDIGKIATPEAILDKPGKLTDEEYAVIKKHPEEGARIVGGIKSYDKIVPGILYHHEHWDGSGYPAGLKGGDIPLLSRIITIADVYDAITADRPYRRGMGQEEATRFMNDMAGKLFDPELLKIFMEHVALKAGNEKKKA